MADNNTISPKRLERLQQRQRLKRHRWVFFGLLVFIGICIVTWATTRNVLPKQIRIATAAEGGLYHRFARILGDYIERRTGRTVTLVPTKGSVENILQLRGRHVDLAVMQTPSADDITLKAVAPLYIEPIHIIVRNDSNIKQIKDLAGRAVSIGPPGSGMRICALKILAHYGIDPNKLKHSERYFGELLSNSELEAAIVTTGMLNPDLGKVLHSGKFRLLPLADAEALSIHHPPLIPCHIPMGFFGHNPTIPSQDVPTTASTAFVAVTDETSDALVQTILTALYEDFMISDLPAIMSVAEAREWDRIRKHPAARDYFYPYKGLDALANMLESLAATKELLFALAAGGYLLWNLRTWYREKQKNQIVHRLKERLDDFLNKTIEIERSQMQTEDIDQLKAYLDDVTEIKLKALDELTGEELRGNREFSIFLLQCSNLIRKIQAKIQLNMTRTGFESSVAASVKALADDGPVRTEQ